SRFHQYQFESVRCVMNDNKATILNFVAYTAEPSAVFVGRTALLPSSGSSTSCCLESIHCALEWNSAVVNPLRSSSTISPQSDITAPRIVPIRSSIGITSSRLTFHSSYRETLATDPRANSGLSARIQQMLSCHSG